MAFDIRNLSEVRALGNNRWAWYYATSDTLATVLGADYFSTVNGLSRLHVGDTLDISASNGAEYQLVSISSVSGGSVTVGQAAVADALLTVAGATALSAKVKALGLASLTDEAFGGKCDAVELTGCSIAASGTTLTVAGGHGLTSADVGKSVYLPLAGAARDGVAMATYLSATTATLEKAVVNALSGADCGFMQSSWNSATGNYDISHVKRTGTATVAAGSTALTDSGAGIISGGSLAYWLPGAFAETLVATISAVPTATTLTLSVAATVAVASGTALVGTDDTAAMAAAIAALAGTALGKGAELRIPRSTILRPSAAISGALKLTSGPNAKVFGIFQGDGTVEKLLEVTGSYVVLEGLWLDGSYSPVRATTSKYVIHSTGAATLVHKNRITNFRTDDTNPSGGITSINSAAAQLSVVHAVYLSGAAGQEVIRNHIDNMSGAGVFTSSATGFKIERNFIGLTMWYSITADRGADDGWSISYNRCNTTHTLGRHWGGIINLMSQIGGAKNKNGKVIGNVLRGTCDYGAAMRILSLEDTEIAHNIIKDIVPAAYTGGPVQYMGVDTRQATGSGDNGPCKRVNIHDNILVANGKNMIGIYAKNSEDSSNPRVARAAAEDIWIWNNVIRSPDASNYFDMGITVHGENGGFDRPRVWNNYVETITRDAAVLSAQSSIVGALSILGTNAQGQVDNYESWGNTVIDLGTPNAGANVGSSRQVGLNIIQYVTNFRCRGNSRYKNFHVGIKVGTESSGSPTAPGISGLEGLTKLHLRMEGCDTDMNLTNGPWETTTSAVAVTWANTHIGKPVIYTSGSFTQTPPTAALLGDAGFIPLYNASVNPITVSMAGGNQTLAAGQTGAFLNINGTVLFVSGNAAS